MAESTNGTLVPPATQIEDASGGIWTRSSIGRVRVNGVNTFFPGSSVLIEYWNHDVYGKDTAGVWWYNPQGAGWQQTTDPNVQPLGIFYGVNNHFDYPPVDHNACMSALGATMLRLNTGGGGDTNANNQILPKVQALQGTNKKVCLVIDSGILGTNESTAYTAGFNSGKALADQFGPLGVTYYEAGNELDRDPTVIVALDGRPGDRRTDYKQTGWGRYRGTTRGLIDGIHASNPNYKVGVHFCVAGAAGAGDMLWNGKTPNGSTGQTTCRWDVTGIHNYEVFGDPWNMGSDGHGANFDLLTYCTQTFGKPIWVSEFNCAPELSDAYKAAYLNRVLPEYYNRRIANNIISIMYYELLSGLDVDNFGLSHNDANPGADNLPQWQAFAAFTASNPA